MKFVESSSVELKEKINSDFKKEIVAFANTDGGEIYIGVSDDGVAVGVENVEKDMEKISCMIHDGIHPDLVPFTTVDKICVEGKDVIRVNIRKGGRPPYYLSDKGIKPSGVYVRHGVTSVPASEELIREMIKESDGMNFDKSRSINQDLTFEYAKRYFSERDVAFEKENQKSLGLIDADGYYTNVALLLSDQCEHSIKCAIFDGTGKTRLKARKEFYGSVLKQLEEAYEYASLLNNIQVDFVGLSRIDDYDYPEFAVREALVNAIVHRDYNYSGSTIINIFSDRMEFVSIGGLVKGLTMTDIMQGVSQSRNMMLANVFYRLKLIESYGTGIQRMIEEYKMRTRPKLSIGPSSFVTELPNLNVLQEKIYTLHEESSEYKVMRLFDEKEEITRKDVENLFDCSSFPARKILNSLLEKRKINVIGNARATKYVLNEDEKETFYY